MKIRAARALAVALSAASPAAAADVGAYDPTLSVRLGTTGIGPEISVQIPNSPFGLRANLDVFSYSLNNIQSSTVHASEGQTDYSAALRYSGTLRLLSGGITADYYPFANAGFRLSAGLIIDGNRVTAHADGAVAAYNTARGTVTDASYALADARLTVNQVAPYVGIGEKVHLTRNIVLSADAGILIEGDPRISVNTAGPLNTVPSLVAAIHNDADRIQHDIAVPVYPVVKIGIGWQFQ